MDELSKAVAQTDLILVEALHVVLFSGDSIRFAVLSDDDGAAGLRVRVAGMYR